MNNPQKRCRMCLEQFKDDELQSMLTTLDDSINLWAMYDYVMNVGVMVDSPAVPYSCMKCKKGLKSAYAFKVICMETEKKLSEWERNDQSIKSEPKTEYFACNDDECVDYSIEENDANDEKFEAESFDEPTTEYVSSNVSSKITIDGVAATLSSDVENCDKSTNGSKTKQVKTEKKMANKSTNAELNRPTCKLCDIQFDQIKDYRAHYAKIHRLTYHRKVHKDRPHSCHKCNITFDNLPLYTAHYRQHHKRPVQVDRDDPASKVICTICGKLFGKRTIQVHIQKMHSDAPKEEHICTVCGKKFKWISNLNLHARIHAGDERYACNICGEKFIHWSARKCHIISKHTGEKK